MLNNELKSNTLIVLNDSTIYGLKNILKREHVINKLFWITAEFKGYFQIIVY